VPTVWIALERLLHQQRQAVKTPTLMCRST
jgi:hypothetical protein